jgi:GNAT superfamily N-acetyltransferase
MSPRVRAATPADREVAVRSIVRAFADDPLLRFFFPGEDRYADGAPLFFGFLFDLDLEGGEVLVADDGLGVSLWEPAGPAAIAPAEVQRRWRQGVSPHLAPGEEDRMDAFETVATSIAAEGPHRYLGVLATDPGARGRGLAAAMLLSVFARDDADGTPARLETCTPDNLPYYERYGFAVHAEADIPGGPRLWELVRRPAAG